MPDYYKCVEAFRRRASIKHQQSLSRRYKRDEHHENQNPFDQLHPQNTKDSCTLFPIFEKCAMAGTEEHPGLKRLCTKCQRIYRVSLNCYPRFVNAATCSDHVRCIFNNEGKPQGTGKPEVLPMYLLRNVGNDSCHNHKTEEFELPVTCQCLLYTHSDLQP
ncbi:unnamed protein product [Cylicocyclus nassatus]|uniref:Uncharacterized protein n=1 Tax=Cylicocyclus nassatus TaxID=53992 RepID=A0AA36DRU6_CYLNA|nr:unnamed protein product [Cylicocyclus nassatus]